MAYMTYREFLQKQAATKVDTGDEVISMDELQARIQADHEARKLGVGGAFVRSLPISLLIAGISGLAIGLKSGSPAAGIATGLITGGVTAGMNTALNANATPEEAGTSFYAAI